MSKKKQPVTIGDFHRMLVLAKWASGIFKWHVGTHPVRGDGF